RFCDRRAHGMLGNRAIGVCRRAGNTALTLQAPAQFVIGLSHMLAQNVSAGVWHAIRTHIPNAKTARAVARTMAPRTRKNVVIQPQTIPPTAVRPVKFWELCY